MLDIFEIAREEGLKEGKTFWGIETTRELVVDALLERFALIPPGIAEQIRNIQNLDVLKGLHRQAVKCPDLQTFATLLQQAA